VKKLTDTQRKFLQMLVDTDFLEKLTMRIVNTAVDAEGVTGDDVPISQYNWFINEILKSGKYGTNMDYKKLNAFGKLYKKYNYVK
jgi:hypothetical protein